LVYFINKLRPVTFNWKHEWGNSEPTIIGLIAQEVEVALDGADFNGHVIKEDGYQELKIEALIMPLISAIKELTARIETLES